MYHSVTAMVGAGVSDVTSSRQCNRCCLRNSTSITSMLRSRSRQQQPGMMQLGCFPPGAVQSQILLGVWMRSSMLTGKKQNQREKAFQGSSDVMLLLPGRHSFTQTLDGTAPTGMRQGLH